MCLCVRLANTYVSYYKIVDILGTLLFMSSARCIVESIGSQLSKSSAKLLILMYSISYVFCNDVLGN